LIGEMFDYRINNDIELTNDINGFSRWII